MSRKTMKLTSYKRTGNYYIDDDDNSKTFEYLFYFDDGTAFVYYLPEECIEEFMFDESNPSIQYKYNEAKGDRTTKNNVAKEAARLRRWISREYGKENTFFDN